MPTTKKRYAEVTDFHSLSCLQIRRAKLTSVTTDSHSSLRSFFQTKAWDNYAYLGLGGQYVALWVVPEGGGNVSLVVVGLWNGMKDTDVMETAQRAVRVWEY